MKKLIPALILLCSLWPFFSFGQVKPHYVGQWYEDHARGKSPVKSDAFTHGKSDFPRTKRYNLKANINQLNSILNTKPDLLDITIPYGDKTYTLNLAKVEITSKQFSTNTDKGNAPHNTGVQYRGIVDHNPAYIASLNLTKTDKSVFFSTDEGNFVLTKDGNEFIVYNEQEMGLPASILCQTPDVSYTIQTERDLISGVGCKTVNVYFECDYAFYQSKGSNVSTLSNYVLGFFNQVATLYANEDIAIQVSEIFAWTVPDPYAALTTPSTIMNSFKATRGTNFNGNVAHFLTTRNVGGGVAYVDVLCNKAYAFGVSMIYNTYSNVPVYSWTINVVAHELGHSLGSPHTHSCSWSGGPLDNCQPPEGSCSPGPAPVNGGTIMSYCHITNVGINFNNGFGPQPGNLIRSKVLNATCIPASTSASPPTSLSTSNISTSSATLAWAPAPSSNNYTVQYKLASASTWTTTAPVTTTSMSLTGLSGNSNYVWSVKADCSAYSPSASFTTTGTSGCIAPTELSNSNITQTAVTLGWAAVAGATGYTVQHKTSAATTWISSTTPTNSITISGLTASTNYIWQVKASCSGYSSQGSFVTTSSSGCAAPAQLTSTNITQTGVTLNWAFVAGSTGYTLQYKPSTASTWTTLTSTVNSKTISGLTSGTSYAWQVKASCSTYSSQASFVTSSSSSGCAAPTQLTNTNITPSGATLTWSPVMNATGYTIQYRPSTSSTWATTTATTNSRSLTGLSAGTGYTWQVKANCSGYSAQSTFTTSAGTSGCAVPTNQNTTNVTTTSATVTWTASSNASSYSIRYKLVGASGWTIKNYISGTSYTITGLLSKRNYQWVMTAKCNNGSTSNISATKYFTTL